MKWHVELTVERDDLETWDDVVLVLPWTDVVGPNGDVNVLSAEEEA